jgi:RNA recognition motif-containing protein
MTDHAAANEAISKLNGKDFMGKDLAVNEARPKIESTGGGNRSGSFNKRY